MLDRPTRREFSAFALALVAGGPRLVRAQDAAPADDKPAAAPAGADAADQEKPSEIPAFNVLPTLPTTPVRRGAPRYNVQMIDTTLLPRDKQGIWVLEFAFKPLRMRTVEVPGKGRRQIHYLYYRVVNRTGKPREFVPQFTLVTDTGKRYEESVLPQAVPIVQAREDPTIRLLGAVDIAGVIPPSTKDSVDDAVFGVALWEGVDPNADRMSIFIRGLSDGYKEVSSPDGGKPVVKYKTIQIDLIRRGDARTLNEREITLAEPAYEWVYW